MLAINRHAHACTSEAIVTERLFARLSSTASTQIPQILQCVLEEGTPILILKILGGTSKLLGAGDDVNGITRIGKSSKVRSWG
jgi:hypothetical protein